VPDGSWKPSQQRGEAETTEVVAGESVIVAGQPSPVFELAEASLDDVAPAVAGLIIRIR
jgi:hypothetical protein